MADDNKSAHFERNVDGGTFALDARDMTITDGEGHRAMFPATAAPELKSAVDSAIEPSAGWFTDDDIRSLDIEPEKGAEADKQPPPPKAEPAPDDDQ